MPDTQRTSRAEAEQTIRLYTGVHGREVDVATATDYLAALDVLERITAVHLGSDVAHRRELERARAFLAATEQETP